MLVIKDKWGSVIFESESYESIVDFAKKHMEENHLSFIMIDKKTGGFHSYIKKISGLQNLKL